MEERAACIKNVCSVVDLFIAPSEFLRKKFIEFGISQDKIIFSQYGFKLDSFKNSKKTISSKLVFAFIGNIIPAKGIHILIKAFNRVKDNNVELKIYGKISSYKGSLAGYLHNMRRLAKNKNIRFMGGFENKDAAKIFSGIDVLIVPSIWQENSPLVIQEAFLAKVLVIASNIGGIPELIKDGSNGLLFHTADADDLYKKMEYMIHNPHTINKFKKSTSEVKNVEDDARETADMYGKLIVAGKQYA